MKKKNKLILINTSGVIVQVSVLVNGYLFFHPYISESIGILYILSLKTISYGVTQYSDYKSANSREKFN